MLNFINWLLLNMTAVAYSFMTLDTVRQEREKQERRKSANPYCYNNRVSRHRSDHKQDISSDSSYTVLKHHSRKRQRRKPVIKEHLKVGKIHCTYIKILFISLFVCNNVFV